MQYTWNDIDRHIADCTQCALSRTRHRPVMGRGNRQADFMLIAEAPGAQEDQQGIPFVGSSGEILDRLFWDCGLSREEVYITNILKCHPPGNRDPKEEEKEACVPYLKYCALTATYHPSAILRDSAKYEAVKKDFLEIVRKQAEFNQQKFKKE